MTPVYRMLAEGDEALRAAVLADLRKTFRALDCSLDLLDRRPRPAHRRALIAAMHLTIRRAEAALDRFGGV